MRIDHPKDCLCSACATIRKIEELLSQESQIKAAWMFAREKKEKRKESIEHLNGMDGSDMRRYEEAWSAALWSDADYQKACVALVNLLIERMGT